MNKDYREYINESYFNWLCTLIHCKEFNTIEYDKLLYLLNKIDFTYTIPLDSNRYVDGCNMRLRYAQFITENDFGFEVDEIVSILDHKCTLLEMLVALSVRCEEHIMSDQDYGDRTGHWFYIMMKNTDLILEDDKNFNLASTMRKINRLLRRTYKPNGEGGLFIVNNGRDLRNVEIWYQMCWYLKSIYEKEETYYD